MANNLSGISYTNNFNNLDGLSIVQADELFIDGTSLDPTLLVPYTGATSTVDLGSQNIKTSRLPTANSDLTNKFYVDGAITTGSGDVLGIVNLNFVKYSGSISDTDLGTYKISSSAVPTTGNNLTNKTYVDTQDALRVPYTGGTSNVVLTGSNKFQQAYNATISDTTTVVNRQTLDSAIAGLGAGILNLNNTWTGTNTFNNNITTGDGYTNTFGNAVYTGVNAITSAVPTTTGITASAPTPLPTITYSSPTYTCTPSGSTTYACFWSSATFTANVRHFFTFTNATTTVYAPSATLTVCQSNVANSGYVAISSAYSLPNTATLFSGYFTPNLNASYVGQIFFILSNVKFTPFTWTAFSYGVGALTVQGNTTMTGALSVSGRLTYAGTSTCEIYNGNIDAYNATGNNNLMIRSWWGIGFPSYDNIVRIGMDTRTGNADFGGTLTTGGNITMASGTFRKNSSANPNNWASIQEGGSANSPYMEFYYGSLRRGYIGNATASALNLVAENNCDLNVYTGGGLRMIIKNSGLSGFGRDPSYTVDINGNQRVYNGLNANDSMTVYGPNASWGAYLVVGSGTDRAGGATAQVISTNGNLHMDAGNSNAMYYGYYANSRGAPNQHLFWGSDIQFSTGIPQNTSPYSGVMCMDGNSLRRSQCVINQIYNSNSVAWGGGVNITYAFYNYNSTVAVCLQGRYSGYWTGSYTAQMFVRIYNQNSGNYYTFTYNTFTNNAYNHVSIPLNCFIGNTGSGWNDVYVYSSGYNTDGNDQLQITVLTLPVNAY
jgi:hypothetical protein